MKRGGIYLPPADFREVSLTGLNKELSNWGLISLGIKQLREEKNIWGKGIKTCLLDTGCDHKDIDVFKRINFSDSPKKDGHGHGTWVGSMMAADGDLVGIAPKSQLHLAKVLNDDGSGNWEWLYKGLEWAFGEGCQVVNISAGGDAPDDFRHKMDSLLKEMAGKNILVICAAGNEGNIHIYPANSFYTLAVGAVNRQIQKAEFSNFGPRMLMMAPGVDLLGCWLDDKYAKGTGTSMASPFGAGVATLAKNLRDLGLTELVAWLMLTSKDLGATGWDPATGFGYLQPKALMKFTVGKRKWTFAWLVNFVMFLFGYWFGDEDYRVQLRTQLRRVLWRRKF